MTYIYEQYEFERLRIVNTIYKLFPCRIDAPGVGRQTRSPFEFIGTELSYLFGLASTQDLKETANHVRSVLQTQSSGTVEIQNQLDALRSLSLITNLRINKTGEQLDKIQRRIVGFSVHTEAALEGL